MTSPKQADELLPCPFCGDEAQVTESGVFAECRKHTRALRPNNWNQRARPSSEPYGYVWFNKHFEKRFTHKLPHPESNEQPIGEVTPVYVAQPEAGKVQDEWKRTVIDELVVCHVYKTEHEDNPREALHALLDWECQVALDPAVSSGAQQLIERGRKESEVDMEALQKLIEWATIAHMKGPSVDFNTIENLGLAIDRAREALRRPSPVAQGAGVDMVLYCPSCGMQHIDEPQPHKDWTNPPHRSHECQHCGTVWRPADVPTNGVRNIATKGKRDTAAIDSRYAKPTAPYGGRL